MAVSRYAESEVPVFQIGDYVVCSNKGVCAIENVTTLNISGVDKEKKYYILKPLYTSGSTVYVPVDSQKEPLLRKVIDRGEAEKLIESISEIPILVIPNDKMTEQVYKDCMKPIDCTELVRLIKTINLRKQKRIQAGKKVTAVDAKYIHLAEDNLYGELAVALDMTREQAKSHIEEAVDGMKTAGK